MAIPSSAIYDYIVRELGPTEHEPDEAPITIVCEPLVVLATGQRAVIGSLDRIEEMNAGTAGTQVCAEAAGGADTL